MSEEEMEKIYSSLKPVVRYKPVGGTEIEVGYRARVIPLDHPSPLIDNGYYASTSPVLSYDPETGNFETQNTRYVLDK